MRFHEAVAIPSDSRIDGQRSEPDVILDVRALLTILRPVSECERLRSVAVEYPHTIHPVSSNQIRERLVNRAKQKLAPGFQIVDSVVDRNAADAIAFSEPALLRWRDGC